MNQQQGYSVKLDSLYREAMNEVRMLKEENIMLKACISQMQQEKLAEENQEAEKVEAAQ